MNSYLRTVLGVVKWVAVIALLLLAFGCSLDRVPTLPLRDADTRFDDPLAYIGPPIEGRWQDLSGTTLDCGSVLNGWAVLPFWTCWPLSGAFKAPSQQFDALVVYDLALAPDSTATGVIYWKGTRDTSWAFTVPLPDSLSSLSWTVWARFSSTDSLRVDDVYDTLTGEWVPGYDVQPAWRVKVAVAGAKVYPTESERRLLRVGPHVSGGSTLWPRP